MPTTEIISVGAGSGPHTPKLVKFAQRCDSKLVSDRSLFQHVLEGLEGTMIHLGDFSDHPEDPSWFCGHVVEYPDPEDHYHIRYEADAFEELITLLSLMQADSPTRHVIFLTDFQLGPEEARIQHLASLDDFQRLNSEGKIRYNTLYHIGAENAEPGATHEPPPRASVSDAPGSSDVGFAASHRFQRRSVS